jgi:hypothetical protein
MAVVVVEQDPSIGTVVDNPLKPDWGPGRIVGTKGKNVWVVFRDHPGREAKLMASDGLRPAASQHDPILDNLPEPKMEKGRPVLPAERNLFGETVRLFLMRYPEGFVDAGYLGKGKVGERSSKWSAHERFQEGLGEGELRRLVDSGSVKTAVTRVLKVIGTMNLLSRIERVGFAEALKNKEAAHPFLSALADVVEAPEAEKATFSVLLDTVASLKVADPASPVATWPVATILPFLARPDAHVLLKPTVSQKAAQGLSFDLKYDPSLNWKTYERCVLLASIYQQKLVELDQHNLAPRDLIDVQAFIWNTSKNWKKRATRVSSRKKKKVVVKEL